MQSGLLFGERVVAVLRKPVSPQLLREHAERILLSDKPVTPLKEIPLETPSNDVLDMKAIERLRNLGGPTLVKNLGESVLTHLPELFDKIDHGIASGDLRAVGDGAHSMRSSAGIVGAMTLVDCAARVEKLSQENNMPETAKAVVELHALYMKVERALHALLKDESA